MSTVTTYLEMRSPDKLRAACYADERFQIRQKERDGRFDRDLYLPSVSAARGLINGRGLMSSGRNTDSRRSCGHLAPIVAIRSQVITICVATTTEMSRSHTSGYCRTLSVVGGGALLTSAIEKRWRMSPSVIRVWVHTSTRDQPRALANYQASGMTIYKVEEE